MTISGMNHLVLHVRDARVHEAFYRDHLDFSTVSDDPVGRFVFMRAPVSDNHHDIAFFTVGAGAGPSAAGRGTVGMCHVAWEVPTGADLAAIAARLKAAGAFGTVLSFRLSLPQLGYDSLNTELLQAAPYLATILAMSLFARRVRPPAALAQPFLRGLK